MTSGPRANRRLGAILAATALCYLVGYPIALLGHSPIGWIFVALGGPLLLVLVAMVIHRVHTSATDTTARPSPPAADQPQR